MDCLKLENFWAKQNVETKSCWQQEHKKLFSIHISENGHFLSIWFRVPVKISDLNWLSRFREFKETPTLTWERITGAPALPLEGEGEDQLQLHPGQSQRPPPRSGPAPVWWTALSRMASSRTRPTAGAS